MAQTLERLTRQTDTMQSIRGIVRTMKTMSAINAAPYEQAARAIEAWHHTVLDGLHAFITVNGALSQASANKGRGILVVMGSDHGLCGNYNEIVAVEARRHAAADTRILCVGAQMRDALGGEGMTPEATLLPPANADGLNRLAGELVTRLEAMRAADTGGDPAIALVFTQRADHGQQRAVCRPLLPLDAALLEDLAARRWQSRSLPSAPMPAPELLAVLIRNLIHATIYRASAEALLTENAARLARMQQAEQSVDDRLDDLQAETRTVRQDEITTELLDVIVGFEALKDRDRKRKRKQPSV
ncbi:F0F1 ATP synthase subunit gamma [Oceaniglobus indicus]|uniref:F0F1 ATP synthase subunit gamma n=1 Tax=Oceaniglobus indicus TaxID=2047749 RepID=UPI000C185DA0|nr:F0F1 ATP synthase subunit gamma [Oceaniglobus indicus]